MDSSSSQLHQGQGSHTHFNEEEEEEEPQARSSEREPVAVELLMAVYPLQTTTLPPSSLGGTEAKFGGANSSSIELGVKTRKVVFWSILEHMGREEHGGTWAWTQLNWIRKGRRRSHLEDQLDHLLDQPVEFLNSTGQASTRSSWKSKSNPKNVASPLTFL
ncbi:unnamed protein product [Microthlaspi erraticum]|uniref:Uncharacterized protein n=1 Tax=Microthlaspi erraticum TaxID=1685480 RepID=A0A6D2LDD1_9BRAS|nr:unnamed protein product [Microthlaspi erraticum]